MGKTGCKAFLFVFWYWDTLLNFALVSTGGNWDCEGIFDSLRPRFLCGKHDNEKTAPALSPEAITERRKAMRESGQIPPRRPFPKCPTTCLSVPIRRLPVTFHTWIC